MANPISYITHPICSPQAQDRQHFCQIVVFPTPQKVIPEYGCTLEREYLSEHILLLVLRKQIRNSPWKTQILNSKRDATCDKHMTYFCPGKVVSYLYSHHSSFTRSLGPGHGVLLKLQSERKHSHQSVTVQSSRTPWALCRQYLPLMMW